MSFDNPTFLGRQGLSDIIGGGGLVHEDPAQLIQGGLPNEHYHMTHAQQLEVDSLYLVLPIANKIYEPVMGSSELALTTSGDCLMAWGGSYAS